MHCSEKYENMKIKENVIFVLNFGIQEAFTVTRNLKCLTYQTYVINDFQAIATTEQIINICFVVLYF